MNMILDCCTFSININYCLCNMILLILILIGEVVIIMQNRRRCRKEEISKIMTEIENEA